MKAYLLSQPKWIYAEDSKGHGWYHIVYVEGEPPEDEQKQFVLTKEPVGVVLANSPEEVARLMNGEFSLGAAGTEVPMGSAVVGVIRLSADLFRDPREEHPEEFSPGENPHEWEYKVGPIVLCQSVFDERKWMDLILEEISFIGPDDL